ncbi:hypothetical protein QT971_22570 [Microcoleus sp. herbarium19]
MGKQAGVFSAGGADRPPNAESRFSTARSGDRKPPVLPAKPYIKGCFVVI